MRTAYVDCVGGIAGDMLLAALIDAGASVDQVLAELQTLGLAGWSARTERVWRGPFAATRFIVELAERGVDPASPVAAAVQGGPSTVPPGPHDPGHGHDHGHDHGHGHGHGHGDDGRVRSADGAHQSRRWSDIRALILASNLPDRVRVRAVATFAALAEAEGRVHGMPAEEVVFHEVGALDSIVDILGVCVALELLGVEEIVVGVLPLGTGHVLGEHGWIPLPAPATVELLRGFSVEGREIRGETVTPTGAALVAALMRPGPLPAMRVDGSGVGAGTWDPASHPNVVRVLLGDGEAGALSSVLLLESEVDGLPGEMVPPLFDDLFAAGAVDVWATPIVMKKGRPGLLLSALCPPTSRVAVGDVMLRQGRTLGYRWSHREREVLARRHVRVETPWGEVRIKLGERAGDLIHGAPEFEDCAALARVAGVPVVEVHAAALAAWAAEGADAGVGRSKPAISR